MMVGLRIGGLYESRLLCKSVIVCGDISFGVNLFAACTVAKISYDEIIPAIMPYVAVVVACLAVITFVPELSLWLRDLVYR